MSSPTLSIGDLVALTGVAEPTLRMWERRHGFPAPARTPSGHRRYSETQVEQVREVLAARQAGLSLPAAIERARAQQDPHNLSPFAMLRRRHPELEPRLIGKPALISLSHAIEDEALARAERAVLFGCFQRERFYRQAQGRWRELARGADAAAVFADFTRLSTPADGPIEVPIERGQPIAREWTLVSYGERSAICMTAREPVSSSADADSASRHFEMIWTVDPEAVRTVAALCADVAEATAPGFGDRVSRRLASEPTGSERDRLALATAVINRTLSGLGWSEHHNRT